QSILSFWTWGQGAAPSGNVYQQERQALHADQAREVARLEQVARGQTQNQGRVSLGIDIGLLIVLGVVIVTAWRAWQRRARYNARLREVAAQGDASDAEWREKCLTAGRGVPNAARKQAMSRLMDE